LQSNPSSLTMTASMSLSSLYGALSAPLTYWSRASIAPLPAQTLRLSCRELASDSADLVRVVPYATMLTGFSKHFRQQESSEEWSWDMSTKCEYIDVFVSHSWRAPRWQKFLGLALHFNGNAALLLAYATASLAFLLQVFDYLPPMGTYHAHSVQKVKPFSAWCLLIGSCTYVVVFLFWQAVLAKITCRSKGAFLDRLCICQDDPQRKLQGVQMLGVFINKSKSVLTLLDPSYFTRLWCILEVAAFSHTHGVGRDGYSTSMDYLPLDLATVVVGLAAAGMSTALCSYTTLFTHFNENVGVWMALDNVGLLLFAPLWVPACRRYIETRLSLENLLQHFHMGVAQCSVEADRVLICASIKQWFGSVEKFEEFVRGDCCQSIVKQVGSWDQIPFSYCLVIGLPAFCVGMDLLAAKEIADYSQAHLISQDMEFYETRLLTVFYFTLLLPALWMRFMLFLLRAIDSTPLGPYHLTTLPVLAILGGVLRWSLQLIIVFAKRKGGVPGVIAMGIAFAILARINAPCCRRRDQISQALIQASSGVEMASMGVASSSSVDFCEHGSLDLPGRPTAKTL